MTSLDHATLEEKVALLSGASFWRTHPLPEHGIPAIVLSDGPHGVRFQPAEADHLGLAGSLPATCFPLAAAVGTSWDPEIAAAVGAGIGRDARVLGVDIVLGPGINIKRSPLCGRNFEYYSEDPLLSGVLGVAHVTGLQATGVGASVKHFAANNQETERMRVSADVDERTLREIYLPAFERVVTEAAPATVMCSYNKINGVYASQNRWLLTEVLREQWGFQGAVVSDWGAVSDRVAALEAGMDLEMPGNGGTTNAEVLDAVRSGRIDEELVTRSAERVGALTRRHATPTGEIDVDAQHDLARRLGADSIVLLKNDGVLPLSSGQTVAVVGPFAEELRFQGGGSSNINPTTVTHPLDAIRESAATIGATVTFARGCEKEAGGDSTGSFDEAVSTAASADVAVVFVGLTDGEESEGFDREVLGISDHQADLVRAVAGAAPRTVVVLSHGGLVTLEGWHDDVDAILDGFLLGQAGGGALADVLFGAVNPSGRLAETIPLRLEDTPSFLSFPGEQQHVRYGEGVMVGYRYYATVGRAVRYPFGHGLSYTSFESSDLTVDVTGHDTATASITVTNTGDRAGKHVVQLYVATTAGPVRRPVRELRAFTKVTLDPGESRRVELPLGRRAFAYYDVELADWVVAPGDYTVQIGTDAHTIVLEQTVELAGQSLVGPLTLESTVGEWFGHDVVGPLLVQGMAATMTPEQQAQATENPDAMKMVESMPFGQFVAFTQLPVEPRALEQLMSLSRGEEHAHV